MKIRHVLFILDGINVSSNDSVNKDPLKQPISPFLEAGFENVLTAI